MHIQVLYVNRDYSYDKDWLDAFSDVGAELIDKPQKLDADLIIVQHSVGAHDGIFPKWMIGEILSRRGNLVIFFTNEFKHVTERNELAKMLNADFICTQLPDGKLYDFPTISLPHALNPKVFCNKKTERNISFGFRGNLYRKGIYDARNEIIKLFQGVSGSDIKFDADFKKRGHWAAFLNKCKATPGAEAGDKRGRIVSPRHLEAIGCGCLNVLLPGEYCGVLSPDHYLTFTTIEEAIDVVLDEKRRSEITERALAHVLENHTYRHRVDLLMKKINA